MNAGNILPFLIPHQLYERLLDMDPDGAYGISYDVYTRKTQDDLPGGWNARRGESAYCAYVYYRYNFTPL